MEEKVACRTPAKGREGETNIPAWKFRVVRAAILAALPAEGLGLSELRTAAKAHVPAAELERLGSWGWHFTTVKLEMEVRGDILRRDTTGPQWIMKAET